MGKIGSFNQITEFSCKDAGTCAWCFATDGKKEYFIKQFENPKYSTNSELYTPKQIEKKLAKCKAFENRKQRLYQAINDNSDGNAVRIEHFFREDTFYYMAMERVKAVSLSIEDIAAMPMKTKCKLCMVVAHAVSGLHKAKLVHCDLKDTNILFTYTSNGSLTAKIIDYDSGFLEDAPPDNPDEFACDFAYLAPEGWRFVREEEVVLTTKMDVFALGVLFHRYLTGEFPQYNDKKYGDIGNAVAFRDHVECSNLIPYDLKNVLEQMLRADPAQRPTMREVYTVFSKYSNEVGPISSPTLKCKNCGTELKPGEPFCPWCCTPVD